MNLREGFGQRDVLIITLDALRYDVAVDALAAGDTPTLATLLPSGWERREAPGTFTLPSHAAMFAGFFPTREGVSTRPVALRFPGSRSIGRDTLVLEAECLVTAYAAAGYRTFCFGGTGFFDPGTPMGAALVARFQEVDWSRDTGVTSPRAPAIQFARVAARLGALPSEVRAFTFVNVAATHPPTRIFARGHTVESVATQRAALVAVDRHLPVLLDAVRARGGAVGIVCSDHGTCFGEDGRTGHRHAHPLVMTVPYAEIEVSP